MPAYERWPSDWPPLADAMLYAAERAGARYVMLGNAYGYPPADGPITEDQPFAPVSIKGEVRAKMWHDALAAHQVGRVQVADVRPGDFIGPDAYGIFTLIVVPAVLAGQSAVVPADLDAPHTFSHTLDTAQTLVAVARDETAFGQAWHVPSNPPVSLRELTDRFVAAAGAPAPRPVRMEPEDFHTAAKADAIVGELPELGYLWKRPFVLDSTKAQTAFGMEPTPLDDALRLTAESFSARV